MPQLIQHIDAIARKKQRDVLYLTFHKGAQTQENYEQIAACKTILEWLEANKVGWLMCGDIANEHSLSPYGGQIYIDVPYNLDDPKYQAVQQFLEYPDGSMRFDGVMFWIVSLERAMKNAQHDAPGFWEQWAENF